MRFVPLVGLVVLLAAASSAQAGLVKKYEFSVAAQSVQTQTLAASVGGNSTSAGAGFILMSTGTVRICRGRAVWNASPKASSKYCSTSRCNAGVRRVSCRS